MCMTNCLFTHTDMFYAFEADEAKRLLWDIEDDKIRFASSTFVQGLRFRCCRLQSYADDK